MMGVFAFISNTFGYVLNWLYNMSGPNYGIAIILFSILLRIILLPITIKQQKTMEKSSELQGKIKEINLKYKNNPEKINQETMALYKSEKMSPFSGCLSAILQIIIILSVFYLVSKPLTYMKKIEPGIIENYKTEIQQEDGKVSNYYEIEIIQKKSQNDSNVYINMEFLGLDLSKVPNQNMQDFTVYIIPALYVISSVISIRMTTNKKNNNSNSEEKSAEAESMEAMSKNMTYFMPIMSVAIAFIAPLGLALYWFISNVLMILERLVIKKFLNSKEDIKNV